MCYEQCRHEECYRCPLDGQEVLENDVQWVEFSVKELLSRKVKCWNEHRGCDKTFAASELSKHFAKDCEHHSTSCPRCSTFVLCSNACKHLQSECSGEVASTSLKDPLANSGDQKAVMSALNAIIDMPVGEVKEMLDHVVNENNAQSERPNEMSHCMNTAKQTQLAMSAKINTLEQTSSSTDATLETVSRNGELDDNLITLDDLCESSEEGFDDTKLTVEEVKQNTTNTPQENLRELFRGECAVLKKAIKKELQRIAQEICSNCAKCVAAIVEAKQCEKRAGPTSINQEKILALSRMNVRKEEFTVFGMEERKKWALSEGSCLYRGKMTYICGYHLSTGVVFRKRGGRLFLCAHVSVRQGIIDDVLQWPLQGRILMTVKQPSENKGRTDVIYRAGLSQPIRNHYSFESNSCTSKEGICLDRLERKGYVVDNSIRVVFELE